LANLGYFVANLCTFWCTFTGRWCPKIDKYQVCNAYYLYACPIARQVQKIEKAFSQNKIIFLIEEISVYTLYTIQAYMLLKEISLIKDRLTDRLTFHRTPFKMF